jgi:hypothetical protein
LPTSESIAKRQDLGFVQDAHRTGDDLDVTCGQFGILRPGEACGDSAFHRNHVLAAQSVRCSSDGGILLRPEDDLGQPLAIAQIDKDDPSVIPARIDPAGKRHALADLLLAQAVAMGRPIHKGREI